MAHHDHATSDDPTPGGPRATQADRYHWQRAAARELAAILEAHADLPAISWTIGPAGSLKGSVNGFASDGDARAMFDAWRKALRLSALAEHSASGGTSTYLRGSIHRNGVKVTVMASVTAEAGERSAETGAAAVPREATQVAPRALPGQGGRRPRYNTLDELPGTRTRGSTARAPLPPPYLPDGPRPVHAR